MLLKGSAQDSPGSLYMGSCLILTKDPIRSLRRISTTIEKNIMCIELDSLTLAGLEKAIKPYRSTIHLACATQIIHQDIFMTFQSSQAQ